MTLMKAGERATTTAGADVDDPDAIPAEIPRHGGNGKPKIRQGDGPNFAYYRRASSYAKPIESEYTLGKWRLRAAVFGTSRNASIRDRLAAVPVFEDKANPERHKKIREELQALADEAINVARVQDRALRGTALHDLSQQADEGADLSHLDRYMRVAIDKWRRIRDQFYAHGMEQFVVFDEYGLGGSYDRLWSPKIVLETPDGGRITPDDRIVGDLKSGANSDYWSSGYRGQLAGYAGGTPYRHLTDAQIKGGATCRPGWPDGITPHQGWALIPHIPVDHPEDTGLVWVDLAEGRKDLDLARRLHERRSSAERDVGFHELTIPGLFDTGPAEAAPSVEEQLDELLGLLASAPDLDAVNALHDTRHEVWTDECTAVVKARIKAGELRAGVAA